MIQTAIQTKTTRKMKMKHDPKVDSHLDKPDPYGQYKIEVVNEEPINNLQTTPARIQKMSPNYPNVNHGYITSLTKPGITTLPIFDSPQSPSSKLLLNNELIPLKTRTLAPNQKSKQPTTKNKTAQPTTPGRRKLPPLYPLKLTLTFENNSKSMSILTYLTGLNWVKSKNLLKLTNQIKAIFHNEQQVSDTKTLIDLLEHTVQSAERNLAIKMINWIKETQGVGNKDSSLQILKHTRNHITPREEVFSLGKFNRIELLTFEELARALEAP